MSEGDAHGSVRASDAERQAVVERLNRATDEGRLTLAGSASEVPPPTRLPSARNLLRYWPTYPRLRWTAVRRGAPSPAVRQV